MGVAIQTEPKKGLQAVVENSLKAGVECYATKLWKTGERERFCGLSEGLEEVPCPYLNRGRIQDIRFYFLNDLNTKWCYGCNFPRVPR